MGEIVGIIVAGAIIGALARLFMKGDQGIGVIWTIVLGALGALEARAGDPERAGSILLRAQEIFTELGDTGGVAVTLRNRAAVASDPAQAIAYLREAEQTARAGGLGRTADRYRDERTAGFADPS